MINKKKRLSIFTVFLMVFQLFISCSKTEKIQTEKIQVTPSGLNCNLNPCADIDVSIIQTSGSEHSEKINLQIQKHIAKILDINESGNVETIEKAILAFNKTYADMKTEFPEELFTFEATVDCNVNYSSRELLTIETDYYFFTGGAHGYEGISFIHFDPDTGAQFAVKDLFKNVKKVAAVCEKAFRLKNNIPEGQSINSTGFNFDKDEFYLPDDIGFERDSVLLYYGSYEINSYADGSSLLKIPFKDLEDQLSVTISD